MQNLTDQEKQILRNAEQLKVTMDTMGWITIVKPLLDKTIRDCLGYKNENNEWSPGELHKQHSSEVVPYTKALIEFENRLHDHFRLSEKIKNRQKVEKKAESSFSFSVPLHDTRYNDG